MQVTLQFLPYSFLFFEEFSCKIEPDYLIVLLKVNNEVEKSGEEYKLLHSLKQINNFNGIS